VTLFDTHVHLHHERLAGEVDTVVARARQAGVTRLLCVAYDLESSRASVDIARRFEGVWATVGVHPHDARPLDDAAQAELEALASDERVAAIGEIGLDFYRDLSPRETQGAAFEAQLELAGRAELPVVIHSREAHDQTQEMLDRWIPKLKGVVMHCFSGSVELARWYTERGVHLGIDGPVTYPKSTRLEEIARGIPDELLLLETDAPYLPPQSHRGKRNEPAYLVEIAARVAEVRGVEVESLARQTTANALRFLGLQR
jgi:TatD DNase family protein